MAWTLTAHETVAVLDYGSQYNMLIARRIRELGVRSVLLPPETSWDELSRHHPVGVVLSGGPASVYEVGAPRLPSWVLECGLPVLGICYGMQLLAEHLGGTVAAGDKREYGRAPYRILESVRLLEGVPAEARCWMSHGDRVTRVPPGFQVLAASDNSEVAAMGDASRRLFGLQFHPEVEHTPEGTRILHNFLDVCGCRYDWTPAHFVEEMSATLKEQIQGRPVACALSGGVDSTVAAVLVHRAVGPALRCYFVDSGVLRRGEGERVMEALRAHTHLNIRRVDAADRFLSRLEGVADPERKRRIIGETFIRVFEDACREDGGADFLVQGTLYPDVIESGPGGATRGHLIKTHHNVGGLPADMQFRVVEPLRELFKDEVRRVGRELEIPEPILMNQPFPGPGLAVRILGEVTREDVAMLQHADAILREELESAGLAAALWQYFAVLLPVRTVGVMGDRRTYAQVVALRAVTSSDGMTADVPALPWEVLGRISSRIVNEVAGVNRVVLDLTTKPPGTIEWE